MQALSEMRVIEMCNRVRAIEQTLDCTREFSLKFNGHLKLLASLVATLCEDENEENLQFFPQPVDAKADHLHKRVLFTRDTTGAEQVNFQGDPVKTAAKPDQFRGRNGFNRMDYASGAKVDGGNRVKFAGKQRPKDDMEVERIRRRRRQDSRKNPLTNHHHTFGKAKSPFNTKETHANPNNREWVGKSMQSMKDNRIRESKLIGGRSDCRSEDGQGKAPGKRHKHNSARKEGIAGVYKEMERRKRFESKKTTSNMMETEQIFRESELLKEVIKSGADNTKQLKECLFKMLDAFQHRDRSKEDVQRFEKIEKIERIVERQAQTTDNRRRDSQESKKVDIKINHSCGEHHQNPNQNAAHLKTIKKLENNCRQLRKDLDEMRIEKLDLARERDHERRLREEAASGQNGKDQGRIKKLKEKIKEQEEEIEKLESVCRKEKRARLDAEEENEELRVKVKDWKRKYKEEIMSSSRVVEEPSPHKEFREPREYKARDYQELERALDEERHRIRDIKNQQQSLKEKNQMLTHENNRLRQETEIKVGLTGDSGQFLYLLFVKDIVVYL